MASPVFSRRAWLLEPGEPLVLSRSPAEAMYRLGEQAHQWGLAIEDLVLSPMCAVGLPRPQRLGGPPRCFGPSLAPEALWCPLLWLPSYLARPAQAEDDDAWAARVALELSASGLWDQVSGTWVDMASFVPGGISTERAAAWLAGASDPSLDAVDLGYLVFDRLDPTWALDQVKDDFGWLAVSSWALWAESVADEVFSSMSEPDYPAEALEMVVQVASTWFADVPEELMAGAGHWWASQARSASPVEILERARALRFALEPWLAKPEVTDKH